MFQLSVRAISYYLGKVFKDSPWYLPVWTLLWQDLQRGTCFRLIFATCLSNEFNLTLMVLICLIWCISMFSELPQLEQMEPILSIVEIFQILLESGSLKLAAVRKSIGLRERSGDLYSVIVVLVFLFLERMVMLLPNFLSKVLELIFFFLQIVFFRLVLRIHQIFLSLILLSEKL